MGQVKWIRTNGGYIDTGYKVVANTRVVLSYETTPNTITACPFLGSRTSTSSKDQFTLWHINNSAFRADICNNQTQISNNPNGKHVVEMTNIANSSFVYDGTSTKMSNSLSGNATYTLYLGTVNTANTTDGTNKRFTDMYIYSFKIYEGDTLKMNFIPYKQETTYGLYDSVSKVFYPSKGTAFTGSPNDNIHIKAGGEWKPLSDIYVNKSGAWKRVTQIYEKENGVWILHGGVDKTKILVYQNRCVVNDNSSYVRNSICYVDITITLNSKLSGNTVLYGFPPLSGSQQKHQFKDSYSTYVKNENLSGSSDASIILSGASGATIHVVGNYSYK